ncbi:DUF58 domain-containing protein [Marinobacter caseinilyticus]|uniref:DUF58 domain-containing protein n=1 Tax=Marinobacter caseinilyticus TaxID=2692195 RepID=UPI001407C0B1|nr:DUF58 domain-containing protein [Marinobacter caseinilyticus]
MTDQNTAIHIALPDLIRLQADARALRLPGARQVKTRQAGLQRSPQRGRGMAFAEVRLYQPGDDIRSIDWRVTARRQSPHTKLYEEERERPILLICDLSPTLYFGSQGAYKQVRCAQLAGILAWLGLWAGDQVGGIVFSGQEILVRRPARRKKSVLQLLDALARFQHDPASGPVQPGTTQSHGLDIALQEARRVAHTGTRIFVLSDFLDVTGETSGLLGALNRHNRVSVLRIVDPLEQALPDSGRFAVAGPDGPVWFNGSDRRFQQAFADKVADHEQHIDHCFRTAGVLDQVISTRDDPAQSLRMILGPRGRIG